MIINKMKQNSRAGFTIVELLIATTVFSVVLLLAMTGFFQIGHIFYKGVSITQTQSVADQIGQDLSASVESASNISAVTQFQTTNYYYACVGKVRYTFNPTYRVSADATDEFTTGQIGLVKDTLNNDGACQPPCIPNPASCGPGQLAWNKPQELLGDKMRVESLSLTPLASVSSSYFTIKLVISYGSDDLLIYTDTSDHSTASCTQQQGGQFCAIGRYNASINSGPST